jgi:hypothetical protein
MATSGIRLAAQLGSQSSVSVAVPVKLEAGQQPTYEAEWDLSIIARQRTASKILICRRLMVGLEGWDAVESTCLVQRIRASEPAV